MSVFGINFHVDTVTVDHGRESLGGQIPAAASNGVTAAILTGARGSGNWTNIHIEQALDHNEIGAGIYCPEFGNNADRIKFDSVGYLPSNPLPFTPYYNDTEAATIKFRNNRGGFVATNILNSGSWDHGGPASYVCVHDELTLKKSGGYHAATNSGTWVGFYARQMKLNAAEVLTSDEDLGPISAALQ